MVQRRAHDGFHGDVIGKGLFRVREHVVGRFLARAHELDHFLRVGGDELVVANVQDGAETAASQLGQLVDSEHLYVRRGPALADEPFLELDHLHVFKPDAGVDRAVDDGAGNVHAAAYGGVVGGRHAVVAGEFVDLNLAEFADVADAFAFEGVEVGGDAAVFEVDDSGKWLVEEGADGRDGEATSFGLDCCQHSDEVGWRSGVHGLRECGSWL